MSSMKTIFVFALLATCMFAVEDMTFSLKDMQDLLGLDKIALELGDIDLHLDDIDQSGLKEYFKQYDIDQNGGYDLKEFTVIYNDDEKPFTEEVIIEHFREADEDNNGLVDYDEMVVFSIKKIPMFADEVDEEQEGQAPSSAKVHSDL